ncbi:MAG: hypothetical protein ACLTER_27325 [Ruminococcus sp.]
MIETAKQCKSVFKSIITYKKKNHEDAASIYVFDSNGDLIYPYDISQEYKAALQPYYELTKEMIQPSLLSVLLQEKQSMQQRPYPLIPAIPILQFSRNL